MSDSEWLVEGDSAPPSVSLGGKLSEPAPRSGFPDAVHPLPISMPS